MLAPLYLFCFICAVLFGALSTWTVRRFAVSNGWAKVPSFDHHVHKHPIPRFGGIAIYVTFALSLAALALAEKFFSVDLGFSPKSAGLLLFPGTLMFAVGLLDDCYELSAHFKLVAQIVCGALLFVL